MFFYRVFVVFFGDFVRVFVGGRVGDDVRLI